ncbi:hypothetical protein [Vibrio owensii]|uniref:hypothetical protein n=1 Tax=Vibrio harveyi group TaxID=717610 RepID=UPI003CC62425
MKLKVALASLALLSCTVSAAPKISNPLNYGELEIKFGGWSHHFGLDEGDSYKYNQKHNGIGFEYFLNNEDRSPHRIGFGYWEMNDSFNHDSSNTGLIYQYDTMTGYPILDAIDLNLAIYYMERTKRIRNRVTYETLRYEDMNMWIVHPYLTIRPTKALSLDLMYVPSLDDEYHVEAFFLRGSLNINAVVEALY